MRPPLAPIVLFTYKRLDTLKSMVESLRRCALAEESRLIIFSDGPKCWSDTQQVLDVREYVNSIDCFYIVERHFSDENNGLATSVLRGVSQVIAEYGKVIVLEDDLIVSSNFLCYMNQALTHFESNKKVFSISGYTIPVVQPEGYNSDVYFTPRASSWGWATWVDRWIDVDWEVSDFDSFKVDRARVKSFNQGGSDMTAMLRKQMEGKINSWAIRWCYHQFKTNQLTVYPLVSKIHNIGFSDQATHSNVYNRYFSLLDDGTKQHFVYNDEVKVDSSLLLQFQHFYSIKSRIFNKFKTCLYRLGLLSNRHV